MQKKYLFLIIPLFIFYFALGMTAIPQNVYAQTCTDTDGGQDYFTKGTCNDTTSMTPPGGAEDKCDFAGNLIEGYCSSADNCFFNTITCPDGTSCIEGACKTEGGLVPDCGSAGNPCGFDDFFVLLHNITEFLIFALAPILVVLMISVGGFTIMASRGNPAQFTTGKNMITWALIGYIVILLAWVIVNTILTSIGVASWVGIGDWWDPTF